MEEVKKSDKNMIITIDTETQGLGGETIVISICWAKKKGKPKTESYDQEHKARERIIQLAKSCSKKEYNGKIFKENTYCYAHNLDYDLFRIFKLNELKIIKETRPEIIEYWENNEKLISFYDSTALFKGKLEEMARQIGLEKGKTNEKLYKEEKQEYTEEEMKEIIKYCENDALIVWKYIEWLKQNCNKNKIKIKKLISCAQIGIRLFNKEIEKEKELKENTMEYNQQYNRYTGQYHITKNHEKTKESYRAGRIQAIKLGEIENCTQIDINSFYPYCATKINFPLLKTEKLITQPLENYNIKSIIEATGASKIAIECPKAEIGTLPIRIENRIEYPNWKSTLIGVWTNNEIRNAIKEGYKIKEIEWTINYQEAERNPLKEFMLSCYEKRKQNNEEKAFWKLVMNSVTGKFGQMNQEFEIKQDDVDEADKYLSNGYKITKRLRYDYIYKKTGEKKPAGSYAPIISSLITAQSRIELYQKMKEIGLNKIAYTAVDGLIFEGRPNKIEYGEEMGQFRIQEDINGEKMTGQQATIYGINTYKIGKILKVSGATINNRKEENGKMTYKKMVNLAGAREQAQIGRFIEQTTDLNSTLDLAIKRQQEEKPRLIADQKTDTSWFTEKGLI